MNNETNGKTEIMIELYESGVSYEEISERVGWTVSTIRGKISRLRKEGLVGKRRKRERKIIQGGKNHFPYKETAIINDVKPYVAGMHICSVCQKTFYKTEGWIYKRKEKKNKTLREIYMCSWNCMRSWDKEHENEKKQVAVGFGR